MASRRLLAIVLVLLAVAWPVAADDGTDPAPSTDSTSTAPQGETSADSGSSESTGSNATVSNPIACVLLFSDCSSAGGGGGGSCSLYELNPDFAQNPINLIQVDPDGCVRGFIRRTLGWPPAQASTALPQAWPF